MIIIHTFMLAHSPIDALTQAFTRARARTARKHSRTRTHRAHTRARTAATHLLTHAPHPRTHAHAPHSLRHPLTPSRVFKCTHTHCSVLSHMHLVSFFIPPCSYFGPFPLIKKTKQKNRYLAKESPIHGWCPCFILRKRLLTAHV